MPRLPVLKAARYLRATPLPHATAAAALVCAALAAVEAALALRAGASGQGVLLGLHACGWAGLALLACADGYSRHCEYLRLRALLARHGFRERILRPVAASRCQRDAALAAARETGCAARTRAYFARQGYRWYHLFPDRVLQNPLVFFSPRFVLSAYFPRRRKTA